MLKQGFEVGLESLNEARILLLIPLKSITSEGLKRFELNQKETAYINSKNPSHLSTTGVL